MEYIYAALLLHKAGKEIKEENVKPSERCRYRRRRCTGKGDGCSPRGYKHRGGHFEGRRRAGCSCCTSSACHSSPRRLEAAAPVPSKEEKKKEEEESGIAGLGALFG